MHITVFVAGTNTPSNSDCLAEAFIAGLQTGSNVTIEKIYVRDLQLDHFTLDHYRPETDQGPGGKLLLEAIQRADAVVFSSPVWNFSVPAHLKNMIDRMGSFALDTETRSRGQLKGKPFFFLFTGGAPLAAWKGLMRFTTLHVREAIRYFGGTIVGTHYVPKCVMGRGVFGCMIKERPEDLQRGQDLGQTFRRTVERYMETGTFSLKLRLIARFYYWGQRIIAKL
jgi:NAD(P)H-dependent FMN reductase